MPEYTERREGLESLFAQEEPKIEAIGEGKSGAFKGQFASGARVLIKPIRAKNATGADQQRGLPVISLAGRAVAFYRLARYLGPGYAKLVKETTILDWKGQNVLVQAWADALHLKKIDPRLKKRKHPEWIEAFRSVVDRVPVADLRRAVVLDCIAASRDRHANNFGLGYALDDQGLNWKLKFWDNDCSFGLCWSKYHNVLHKYRFTQAIDLTEEWSLLERITQDDFYVLFEGLISPEEARHAYKRVRFMLDFPYRLPFAVFTKGEYDPNQFPSYAEYFK